jgi:hypothetical protein
MKSLVLRPLDEPPSSPAAAEQRWPVLPLASLACMTALALHAPSWSRPMVRADDFPIVMGSWTWEAAWANLWRPFNEHVMPLGRISTWCLVWLAGSPTGLPLATALQGPLAVVLGMCLLARFVHRETGSPWPALAAMIFFGVSSIYVEAVAWFAASFAVLALDTILLALLAAQGWQQSGRHRTLGLCAIWSALAPGWFAGGILAGPLCSLYLLPGGRSWRTWRSRILPALVPLLGSAAFLAVSLPLTAQHIMHLPHYAGKTALEAFHPVIGLKYTGHALVDNLALGVIGISGHPLPCGLVAGVLILLAGAAAWWWRRASRPRLLLLGLGFILSSYWLIYSARAEWSYEDQMVTWTRYNLLPQLGLALFLSGGLMPVVLTRWRMGTLLLAMVGLLVIQFPRVIRLTPAYDPDQGRLFERVREVDARCRAYHISAATARQVLQPLPMPWWDDEANGWIFLRGSETPRDMSPEEARRLLGSPEALSSP